MTPEEISQFLQAQFGERYEQPSDDAWQVETDDFRLLLLLSADGSWLRALIPIVPAASALPFLSQILEANFDLTQETRYALYQDVLWGVFQHDLATLQQAQLEAATTRLLKLKQNGTDIFFNQMVESKIRKIIAAAKLQGQTLEATLQTLDRFYAEGMMGELTGGEYQEAALSAWRRQLERLWPKVNAEKPETR